MLPQDNRPAGLPEASNSEAVGRLALRFGVGVGIACAAWLVFLQATGNNPFGPKQLLGQMLVPLAAAGSQWTLRRILAPGLPGLGRALAVGGLTVLLAAAIAAGSVWGLARSAGEAALARNRAEVMEIIRVQQEIRPKEKRNAQYEAQEMQRASTLTVRDLATGTFTRVLLLGLLVGVPSGIFLRK